MTVAELIKHLSNMPGDYTVMLREDSFIRGTSYRNLRPTGTYIIIGRTEMKAFPAVLLEVVGPR